MCSFSLRSAEEISSNRGGEAQGGGLRALVRRNSAAMGNEQSTSIDAAGAAGAGDASYEELGRPELRELLLSFREQLGAEFLDQDNLGQYSLAVRRRRPQR